MRLSRGRAVRLLRALLVLGLVIGLVRAIAASGDDDKPKPHPLRATVATPAASFASEMIVEGIHGFAPAEVAHISAAVGSTALTVTDGEVYVIRGRGAYNELPLSTLVASPAAYARAAGVPRIERALRAGALLATSTARLFHWKVGDRLRVAGGPSLPVSAIVADRVLGGHQMAVRRGLSVGLGNHASYVLIHASQRDRIAVEVAIHRALPTRRLRFIVPTPKQYFSPSGDVLSQSQIDQRFGPFLVRRTSTGFEQDPAWIAAHLVQRRVVQLGVVVCNKRIIGPLTAAMQEITRRGLGKTINTADFGYEGGCWNSRMSRFEPGNISHHAWGMAIDINVAANPLGAAPHQDPRLVRIMAQHGFTWGGQWLRRDGNHFEWVGADPNALAG